jgi:hypothetical protein
MNWLMMFLIGCVFISNGVVTAETVFADHLPGSMLTGAECSEKMGRDCFCWELGSCSFTDDPLGTMLLPYDSVFSGLAIVIFWAMIVGLLWLRTESPQLVGIVGIAMVSSYMAYIETEAAKGVMVDGAIIAASAEFETARIIGITLLVVSFGIAFYQMITTRLLSGPQ